jgi:hypothetical protein
MMTIMGTGLSRGKAEYGRGMALAKFAKERMTSKFTIFGPYGYSRTLSWPTGWIIWYFFAVLAIWPLSTTE